MERRVAHFLLDAKRVPLYFKTLDDNSFQNIVSHLGILGWVGKQFAQKQCFIM